MKIVQETHRLLMHLIDNLPQEYRNVSRNYGVSIFKKTRFGSHVNFLRRCLKKSIIPNGFRIKPTLQAGLPHHLSKRVLKAMDSFSRKLLRTSLQHFSNCLDKANHLLSNCKRELALIQDPFVSHLKFEVYKLNQRLYNDLKFTKDRKFDDLQQNTNVNHINDELDKLVVTIPSDLDLTEDEKRLLSKGLTFIPTPSYMEKSLTLQEMNEFYRRIKLHVFFNDTYLLYYSLISDFHCLCLS